MATMSQPRWAADPEPTPFTQLNEVLRALISRAGAILNGNMVGAYLQGSFAVGDADLRSDCDFLIPVYGPITPAQEAGLRALHDELPTRPEHWNQHLEGSYPPVDELRTLTALDRPWLYIDHGQRAMEWSTHCNTEVVRWSLRECGVTLAGPAAATLVDPVGPDVLRARMRHYAVSFLPDLLTWCSLDIAWGQRYAVAQLCRILQTLDEGRVTSKKAALQWGLAHLDRSWSRLIQQALDDRALDLGITEQSRPGSASETKAFAAYVRQYAACR
jgi:hypothetical protein